MWQNLDSESLGELGGRGRCLGEPTKLAGGPSYDPKLVIIVGQKRHQTRFFLDDGEGCRGPPGAVLDIIVICNTSHAHAHAHAARTPEHTRAV